jgi:hypothetical protein
LGKKRPASRFNTAGHSLESGGWLKAVWQSVPHRFVKLLRLPCALNLNLRYAFFNPLLYQLSYRAKSAIVALQIP